MWYYGYGNDGNGYDSVGGRDGGVDDADLINCISGCCNISGGDGGGDSDSISMVVKVVKVAAMVVIMKLIMVIVMVKVAARMVVVLMVVLVEITGVYSDKLVMIVMLQQ